MQPQTLTIDEEVIGEPSWQQVEDAIRSLDGSDRTGVTFGADGEVPHMAVGGGTDEKYVAYVAHDNEVFHQLAGQSGSGKVTMVVCGQCADYDATECAALPAVLKAAKWFYETGDLEPSLRWIRR